jgi:hypothetical protein
VGLVDAESSRKQEPMRINKRKGKCPSFFYHSVFVSDQPYNKVDLAQHAFLEDLVLYIAIGCCLIYSIENH